MEEELKAVTWRVQPFVRGLQRELPSRAWPTLQGFVFIFTARQRRWSPGFSRFPDLGPGLWFLFLVAGEVLCFIPLKARGFAHPSAVLSRFVSSACVSVPACINRLLGFIGCHSACSAGCLLLACASTSSSLLRSLR